MTSKSKVKKKNSFLKKALTMVGTIIIFFFIGILLGTFTKIYGWDEYLFNENDNVLHFILIAWAGLLVFFISVFIHVIIHELGHLIFGLFTGFSFVSFRIGPFIIKKEDKKIKLKKYSIPGTAGQCLMMPAERQDGKNPFIIYNLGGVIMNLITATISLLLVIFIRNISFPLSAIMIIFALAGIYLGITNGIPITISGVPTDGYNIRSMIKDPNAQKNFYIQLKANALLSDGVRYKELNSNWIQLEEGIDLTNPLNTSIKLLEYNWHLDNLDFNKARESINSLVPLMDDIVGYFKMGIDSERIFLELVGECNKDFIDELYDDELKKYIKASKYNLGSKRLMMAYEAFYNEDKDKALKYYKELEKLHKSNPIKGDADMELMIGDWIREKIDEKQV